MMSQFFPGHRKGRRTPHTVICMLKQNRNYSLCTTATELDSALIVRVLSVFPCIFTVVTDDLSVDFIPYRLNMALVSGKDEKNG